MLLENLLVWNIVEEGSVLHLFDGVCGKLSIGAFGIGGAWVIYRFTMLSELESVGCT